MGRSKLYLAIKNGDLKARKYGKRTIIEYQDGMDFIRRLTEMKSKWYQCLKNKTIRHICGRGNFAEAYQFARWNLRFVGKKLRKMQS